MTRHIIPPKEGNARESFKKTKKENCRSGNRCNQFRVCEACNKIRQAKTCDKVEMASKFSRYTTNATVMPYGAGSQSKESVGKLKTNILTALKPHITGAMVSVEVSDNDALHLNFVLNSRKKILQSIFEKLEQEVDIGLDTLLEPISPSDVRNRTAYALKYRSIPTQEQYNGNLVNTTGDVRRAGQVIRDYKLLSSDRGLVVHRIINDLTELGIKQPGFDTLISDEHLRTTTAIFKLLSDFKNFGKAHTGAMVIISKTELAKHITLLLNAATSNKIIAPTTEIFTGSPTHAQQTPQTPKIKTIERKVSSTNTDLDLNLIVEQLNQIGVKTKVEVLRLQELSEQTKVIRALLEQFKCFGYAHTQRAGTMNAEGLRDYINILLNSGIDATQTKDRRSRFIAWIAFITNSVIKSAMFKNRTNSTVAIGLNYNARAPPNKQQNETKQIEA
jgi:hypothetical protein